MSLIENHRVIVKVGIITDQTIEKMNMCYHEINKNLYLIQQKIIIKENDEEEDDEEDEEEDDEDREVAYYHDCQQNDAIYKTKVKCIEYEYQQFCTLFSKEENILKKMNILINIYFFLNQC